MVAFLHNPFGAEAQQKKGIDFVKKKQKKYKFPIGGLIPIAFKSEGHVK
jgi:hypothetical protein